MTGVRPRLAALAGLLLAAAGCAGAGASARPTVVVEIAPSPTATIAPSATATRTVTPGPSPTATQAARTATPAPAPPAPTLPPTAVPELAGAWQVRELSAGAVKQALPLTLTFGATLPTAQVSDGCNRLQFTYASLAGSLVFSTEGAWTTATCTGQDPQEAARLRQILPEVRSYRRAGDTLTLLAAGARPLATLARQQTG